MSVDENEVILELRFKCFHHWVRIVESYQTTAKNTQLSTLTPGTVKFITLEVTLTHVFDNTPCWCNGSIFIASLSRRSGSRGVHGVFRITILFWLSLKNFISYPKFQISSTFNFLQANIFKVLLQKVNLTITSSRAMFIRRTTPEKKNLTWLR